MESPESVLDFWFPPGLDADEAAHRERIGWWFRAGADADILARFVPLVEAAARGELDPWKDTPRGRLALILVLDQFPRSVYRGSPRAYSLDAKAAAVAVEGLDRGMDAALPVWERLFFALPLSHSEDLGLQERAVAYAARVAGDAPPSLRALYEFSASQARGHRDTVARFGRHPHRNAVLGRQSTSDELEHLARESPVHERKMPG